MRRRPDLVLPDTGSLLDRRDLSGALAMLPDARWCGEQLCEALLRCSQVGVAICDPQLRFQLVNATLARMNGVPAKSHLGRTLAEILGSAASLVGAAFERVFSTGRALRNFELTAVIPSRTTAGRWLEDYFPLKNDSGRVQQVAAIVVELPPGGGYREVEGSLSRLRSVLATDASRGTQRSLRLTPREREIIPLLAEGKTNRQAAAILGLSVRTIESHRAEIMRRLKLNSLSDLVRYAIRYGIVSL